jgi:DNA-binding NtrC family response regulator
MFYSYAAERGLFLGRWGTAMDAKVLVIDDEQEICALIGESLIGRGLTCEKAYSGAAGLEKMPIFDPDVVFLDVRLGDADGLEVLKSLLQLRPNLSVIVMSGHGSVSVAVEAMKRGAFHYLTKPFSLKEVDTLLDKALERLALNREVESLRREHDRTVKQALSGMVGDSPAMQDVKAVLAKVAHSPATTVLIQGETGTGKEVAARTLHYLSEQRNGPFVAVNCSAIPENLVESELFGHERGAFTDAKSSRRGLLEEAENGTFFLDEISDLPLGLQAKLLRVLQERVMRPVGGNRDIPVNTRVIAASNRNLFECVQNGTFREDLYYRLQVVPITLPPLREREEDLEPLLNFFIQQFAQDFKRPPTKIYPSNLEVLRKYHWPGNIRELRNCVERAMLLGLPTIEPGITQTNKLMGQTTQVLRRRTSAIGAIPVSSSGSSERDWVLRVKNPALEEVEKELIFKVLDRCGGNKIQAAELLGINRTTLYRKLAQYQIGSPGADEAELSDNAASPS